MSYGVDRFRQSDPIAPAGPPVAADGAAQVSVFSGMGIPMYAHPAPAGRIVGDATTMPPEVSSSGVPVPAGPSDSMQYFNLDELKTEMKKLAWTKGDFTVTPYGSSGPTGGGGGANFPRNYHV